MPSITSSSKGGDKLRLYTNERNALTKSHAACRWIWNNGNDKLADAANEAASAIETLLALIPAEEKTAKQTA